MLAALVDLIGSVQANMGSLAEYPSELMIHVGMDGL